jgi:hypothetical protein
MPSRRPIATFLALGSAVAGLAGCSTSEAAPQAAGSAAQPVVVELFQSQGCSSCPPANADLNAIAGRSDLLVLSFAVTYWDRLGWKDTFGSPRFPPASRTMRTPGAARSQPRSSSSTAPLRSSAAIARRFMRPSRGPDRLAADRRFPPAHRGWGSNERQLAHRQLSGWSATIRDRATCRSARAKMAAALCLTAISFANW